MWEDDVRRQFSYCTLNWKAKLKIRLLVFLFLAKWMHQLNLQMCKFTCGDVVFLFMFCSFLSVQHYRITIELSGSVSGLSLLIDVCSALISFTVQPFVLMAATTSSCSTRRGSVPEMCTPSSWRWPMRKYDLWPLWRLTITQPVFSPFTLLSLEEAGEVPLALVHISIDSVKEHQMEGGQRRRSTDLGKPLTVNMNTWKH